MSPERERMLAGELYKAADAELTALRRRARELLARFNASPEPEMLRELFGRIGEDAVIEPPFHCDYGENIAVGARFYANVGWSFSTAERSRSATASCSAPASTSTPRRTRSTRRHAGAASSSLRL